MSTPDGSALSRSQCECSLAAERAEGPSNISTTPPRRCVLRPDCIRPVSEDRFQLQYTAKYRTKPVQSLRKQSRQIMDKGWGLPDPVCIAWKCAFAAWPRLVKRAPSHQGKGPSHAHTRRREPCRSGQALAINNSRVGRR